MIGRSSHGVMANILDCGLEVSEFKLHSPYYIHFRTNACGKGTEPSYFPSYALNRISARMALALNNQQRLMCH